MLTKFWAPFGGSTSHESMQHALTPCDLMAKCKHRTQIGLMNDTEEVAS